MPVLGLTALWGGIGVGLAALYTQFRIRERRLREKPSNQYWRDLRITLGELPIPAVLPTEDVVLSGMSTDEGENEKLSPEEPPTFQQRLSQLPAVHRELIVGNFLGGCYVPQ